jgi:hypothetical protein
MNTEFKNAAGVVVTSVPANQVDAMKKLGLKEVKKARGRDRTATNKSEDTAETKAASEVKPGQDRTR